MSNRIKQIEKAINNLSNDKFNELLNELGVKGEQWEPQIYETYWSVLGSGYIDFKNWAGDDIDNYRLLMNNVFKTEEEAEAQCDFNIGKAKLIKEIEKSSDVIDWGDREQSKYQLVLVNNTLEINVCYVLINQGATYTTNLLFLENLIENEPERVKKYLFGIGGV